MCCCGDIQSAAAPPDPFANFTFEDQTGLGAQTNPTFAAATTSGRFIWAISGNNILTLTVPLAKLADQVVVTLHGHVNEVPLAPAVVFSNAQVTAAGVVQIYVSAENDVVTPTPLDWTLIRRS